MKTEPIAPAEVQFAPDQPPRAPRFDDVYHPRAGAGTQARQLFLAGNGLPGRWHGREHFVVLETGFGLGHNFLATWQAWRADAGRCRQLVFVSIDKHPPTRETLVRAHAQDSDPALSQALIDAWPPLTPNLHLLDFDDGALRLLLAWGDVEAVLPQLQLRADAIYLDGFAPSRNPAMWSPRVLGALARCAAAGATLATWSVARGLREGLRSQGFEAQRQPGFGGKREHLVARYAPAFVPRRTPGRQALRLAPGQPREALVIGAGLAGAAAAQALARQGWACTVLDRHALPAAEASGNPGGLFHGTAHADDGVHARFHRSAALLAARRYAALIAAGTVPGQAAGLLRLHPAERLPPLPPDYVQGLDAAQASADAGLQLDGGAWCYPGGGWISPAAWCHQALSGPGIRLRTGHTVSGLHQTGDGWQALAADGGVLASAPLVVLATGAADAPPVTLAPAGSAPAPTVEWPNLQPVRGQVTWLEWAGTTPARPLSGHGYVLRLDERRVLCGATTAQDDPDPAVRDGDHVINLERLAALTGWPLEALQEAPRGGRVGWRALAADRLPCVGALPLAPSAWPAGARGDQCRIVPRVPGLFMLGGLASRGLTWAPLAGEVLSAWVDGRPMPLEADLLDAIDPARFLVRRWRRASAAGSVAA